MKRYCVLIAAVLTNMCLGGVYAWNIFVPELVRSYGYNTAQTQLVFGTIIYVLTLTMLFKGKLESKAGPWVMLLVCGVLLAAVHTAAGYGRTCLPALWLGYGVVSGFAIGFGYVTLLAVMIRWFEKRKGFACGMIVAAYGFGAVILSFIAQMFLDRGWDVMSIFELVGVFFGSVICVCAIIIKNPEYYSRETCVPTIQYRQVVRNFRFWILAMTTGLATFPGLMILGNLKPIAASFGYKSSIAVLAISLISVGNAAGRVVGGAMHDRFRESIITTILIMIIMGLALLFAAGAGGSIGFIIIILMIGISYGGIIAGIPSQVAHEYGHENFGRMYPIIFTVHGMAAIIAAPFGGYI